MFRDRCCGERRVQDIGADISLFSLWRIKSLTLIRRQEGGWWKDMLVQSTRVYGKDATAFTLGLLLTLKILLVDQTIQATTFEQLLNLSREKVKHLQSFRKNISGTASYVGGSQNLILNIMLTCIWWWSRLEKLAHESWLSYNIWSVSISQVITA